MKIPLVIHCASRESKCGEPSIYVQAVGQNYNLIILWQDHTNKKKKSKYHINLTLLNDTKQCQTQQASNSRSSNKSSSKKQYWLSISTLDRLYCSTKGSQEQKTDIWQIPLNEPRNQGILIKFTEPNHSFRLTICYIPWKQQWTDWVTNRDKTTQRKV